MVLSLQIMGLSAEEAAAQVVADGRGSPEILPGRPIIIVYVDNGEALCWDGQDRLQFLGAFRTVLSIFDVDFTCKDDGSGISDAVGLRIDVSRRILLCKPDRMWRV